MKDKRQALLDSALELFSTRGYQNTPTSLISKQAGVATGTLFHHFASKEELINQLYLSCKVSFMTSIKDKLSELKTVDEQIRVIWESMISWALENENRYLFIMQHHNASFINKETREEAASQLAPLLDILKNAKNKGLMSEAPEDLQVEVISYLLTGTVSFFLRQPEKFDEPAYREGAYKMFLRNFEK